METKKKDDNWMYFIVMFDLPVKTKEQVKQANQFRNFLKKSGYVMMNFSVYSRFIKGMDYMEKYEKNLTANLPKNGNIRTLMVTEKQFKKMRFLVGEKKLQDKLSDNQLSLSL
jgi:CRISPR-associated protein Cas2